MIALSTNYPFNQVASADKSKVSNGQLLMSEIPAGGVNSLPIKLPSAIEPTIEGTEREYLGKGPVLKEVLYDFKIAVTIPHKTASANGTYVISVDTCNTETGTYASVYSTTLTAKELMVDGDKVSVTLDQVKTKKYVKVSAKYVANATSAVAIQAIADETGSWDKKRKNPRILVELAPRV